VAAEPLAAAAARRHHDAHARTIEALAALNADGLAVSFSPVARRADVSRQWLYTQPEPAAPRAPGHTPGEGQKEVVEATDRAAAQDPGNAPWAGDPVGRPALLAESSVGRRGFCRLRQRRRSPRGRCAARPT